MSMNRALRRGLIIVISIVAVGAAAGTVAMSQANTVTDDQTAAIQAATKFVSASAIGAPVLVGATKGSEALIARDGAEMPPELRGKEFWMVTFNGAFRALRPPPPLPNGGAAPSDPPAHKMVVYVQNGRVVGAHGSP